MYLPELLEKGLKIYFALVIDGHFFSPHYLFIHTTNSFSSYYPLFQTLDISHTIFNQPDFEYGTVTPFLILAISLNSLTRAFKMSKT